MATGQRKDPLRAFQFLVELDGITRASFRECSGLDSSQDPIEYREGGEGLTARKLPGLNKYANISLKRGITDDTELWAWRHEAAEGRVKRKNGSIILMDESGAEAARWNLDTAWPATWTGPSLNATGNEVAIETLELVHEGIARV